MQANPEKGEFFLLIKFYLQPICKADQFCVQKLEVEKHFF